MNLLVALGISIGVLAGTWVYIGLLPAIALPVWVGVISWACFYAVGGKKEGLLKTLCSNLSGLLWGFLIVLIYSKLGGSLLVLSVAVAVGCFIMCVQANIKVLSFIPGAFAATASYFSVVFYYGAAKITGRYDWLDTAICLVAGALLAFLSEAIGTALSNIGKKKTA
jgi:hypothetical protein